MIRLSLSTFRERWQLFIGALLTVCLGVALVQSSLLTLLSAVASGYVEAITLLAMTLAVSTFLAVFVVGSTFAFTVAERTRDLALLRLVGAGRGQVRRLLLGEALLLGLLGAGIGAALGTVVLAAQSHLLRTLGFVPAEFTAPWRGWILGVCFGVGVGVALAGVLVASRRAARVRPLEALRDTGQAARVMTGSRWFFGVLFLAGAVALVVMSRYADGPESAIPLAVNATFTAAVALSALSPLIVPVLGGLFGLAAPNGPIAGLARANLRDGVRRSASTAAPLLVFVALLLGQSGMLASITEAAERERRRDLRADLVVTGEGRPEPALVPGVAVSSSELSVPLSVTRTTVEGDGELDVEADSAEAAAVDPAGYERTHRTPANSGALSDLRGDTIAVGPGSHGEYELGETVEVHLEPPGGQPDGRELSLRVVAVLPPSLDGGPDFLLPRTLLGAESARAAPSTTLLRLQPGADAAAVAAGYARLAGVGAVSTANAWLARDAAQRADGNARIMVVVMGLAGGYAVIAVVNAVVIGAAQRRREFAVARVSGLTRGQVVRAALAEAGAVAAAGLSLGVLAAAGTLTSIGWATRRITGEAVVVVPWSLLAAVVAGSFAVVALSSVWTTLAATRHSFVSLVAARE